MGFLRLLPANIIETEGEAIFLGKNLMTMTSAELGRVRWLEMAIVFQKAMNSLSPIHRIGAQMEDIYRVHYPNIEKHELKQKIIGLLKLVNLPERVYSAYPHELSGGMMQRVSIALSLLFSPKLLVFDEATTALDVVTQSQILNEIMALEKTMKIARIMITHDVSVVASTCNRIVVMYAGRMMEEGYVKDVLVNPKHPYTIGLLKSFPSFDGERMDLRGIPGGLPDLSIEPSGCVFAPRCPQAQEHCFCNIPQVKPVGPQWQAACHLIEGECHE
ncbi:Oligopeptide transport ATP-binding protein OppD [bioreactor metagenome]|uniref:Oligopeptide transport ATP-binding protein OppD n=1 Tax=bioreactor metagenome TaxID=1076179 RepID=A0A645ELS0_9ZZZZ